MSLNGTLKTSNQYSILWNYQVCFIYVKRASQTWSQVKMKVTINAWKNLAKSHLSSLKLLKKMDLRLLKIVRSSAYKWQKAAKSKILKLRNHFYHPWLMLTLMTTSPHLLSTMQTRMLPKMRSQRLSVASSVMETVSMAWLEKSVNSLIPKYAPNLDSMEQDNHVAATEVRSARTFILKCASTRSVKVSVSPRHTGFIMSKEQSDIHQLQKTYQALHRAMSQMLAKLAVLLNSKTQAEVLTMTWTWDLYQVTQMATKFRCHQLLEAMNHKRLLHKAFMGMIIFYKWFAYRNKRSYQPLIKRYWRSMPKWSKFNRRSLFINPSQFHKCCTYIYLLDSHQQSKTTNNNISFTYSRINNNIGSSSSSSTSSRSSNSSRNTFNPNIS